MKTVRIMFPLIALLCIAGIGFADVLNNNEVQFSGTVKTVTINGEGNGTLFVTLDTIDLRVIVNPKTIIQDKGTEILSLEALTKLANAGPGESLIVEVTGKFSSSGILANRVRVVEDESDFNLRGHVTAVQFLSEQKTSISLLGITVVADTSAEPPTSVQSDGADIPVSAIRTGTDISVTGTILQDGTWAASQIKVLSAVRKKSLVFFEGTVKTYDSTQGTVLLEVTGATANVTTVLLTPETTVQGDLKEGVHVMVVATINTDLSFTAREIRVLAALEIKPDERKLAVGGSATFTIKLRETAAADVPVTLALDKDGVIAPLAATSLTIPAGSQTVDFTVTAAAAGTVTITAKALGEQASALVVVGALSEEEGEPPAGQVRISFSPDHIKMNPNETREVVLHVQPPQRAEVAVTLASTDETVVPVPTARVLSSGAAMLKVLVQSTGKTGKASITAALPQGLGGFVAELVVEVEGKKSK